MTLCLHDVAGRAVACIAAPTPLWRVPKEHPERFDVVVFGTGEDFDDGELLGWLPGDVLVSAPKIKKDAYRYLYEVAEQFIWPMPDSFDFESPDLNVPMVWSYREKALWTPYGFYLYSAEFAAKVERTDNEIRGVNKISEKKK